MLFWHLMVVLLGLATLKVAADPLVRNEGAAVLKESNNDREEIPVSSELEFPEHYHIREFEKFLNHQEKRGKKLGETHEDNNGHGKETMKNLIKLHLSSKGLKQNSRHRHREREEERERERIGPDGKKERERERMRQRERERERVGHDGKLVKELEKETEGERQRQRLGPNGKLQEERERFRYRARGQE